MEYQVGTILTTINPYGGQHPSFYLVTKVTPKGVYVRELAKHPTRCLDGGYWQWTMEDVIRPLVAVGDPIYRPIRKDGFPRIEKYAYTKEYTGEEERFSD